MKSTGTIHAMPILFGFLIAVLSLVKSGEAAERSMLEDIVSVSMGDSHRWNTAPWDQHKVITHGDFQYAAFWNSDIWLTLARRNLQTGEIQRVILPYSTNPNDAHNQVAIGMSPQAGRIHIGYHVRGRPKHPGNYHSFSYLYSNEGFITNPPEHIAKDDFNDLTTFQHRALMTYPRFFNDASGALYLLFRVHGSGNGDHFLYKHNPATNQWTQTGKLFSRAGTYAPTGHTSRNAYLRDVLFDENDRLHVAWTWREHWDWPKHGCQNFNYAYSDDCGVTWYNNEGVKVADLAQGDAIDILDPVMVFRIPGDYMLINQNAMALDSNNQPHAMLRMSKPLLKEDGNLYVPGVSAGEATRAGTHLFHAWRETGGEWKIHTVAEGAFSRGDFAIDKNDNLFLIVRTGGTLVSCQAAAGRWDQWTTHPLAEANVRGEGFKYDRFRWVTDGILSVPMVVEDNGEHAFVIKDFHVQPKGQF